jgi:hypothetical protein
VTFTVHGYCDAVLYWMVVDPDVRPSPLMGRVMDCAPDDALWRIASHVGEKVWATATGPALVVDLDDPRSVIVALREFTEVIRIEGDVPELYEGERDEPTGLIDH